MPEPVELTLLTKPGCHLCDDARVVVEQVCDDVRSGGLAVKLDERNILEDAELMRAHAEDIPVVFVNGRRHAIWRIDAERLLAAITKAAKR